MLEDLVNWILFPVNVPFHYMNNGGLTKDDTTNSTSIYHLIRNFMDNVEADKKELKKARGNTTGKRTGLSDTSLNELEVLFGYDAWATLTSHQKKNRKILATVLHDCRHYNVEQNFAYVVSRLSKAPARQEKDLSEAVYNSRRNIFSPWWRWWSGLGMAVAEGGLGYALMMGVIPGVSPIIGTIAGGYLLGGLGITGTKNLYWWIKNKIMNFFDYEGGRKRTFDKAYLKAYGTPCETQLDIANNDYTAPHATEKDDIDRNNPRRIVGGIPRWGIKKAAVPLRKIMEIGDNIGARPKTGPQTKE